MLRPANAWLTSTGLYIRNRTDGNHAVKRRQLDRACHEALKDFLETSSLAWNGTDLLAPSLINKRPPHKPSGQIQLSKSL